MFRTGRPVSLARALPIFTQMGIEVLDERPYELDVLERDEVWIYDFGLRLPAGIFQLRGALLLGVLELLDLPDPPAAGGEASGANQQRQQGNARAALARGRRGSRAEECPNRAGRSHRDASSPRQLRALFP